MNFTDKLEDIVQGYNNSYHRSIGMTPNQAETKKYQSVLFINHRKRYKKIEERAKKFKLKFKQGDLVRIKASLNKIGARSYDQKFLEEIFIITKVNTHLPVTTYSLKDYNDEPVMGTFYYQDLVKVQDTGVYKVEKVLKRQTFNKKKYLYVKFKGWPTDFNGWIIEK